MAAPSRRLLRRLRTVSFLAVWVTLVLARAGFAHAQEQAEADLQANAQQEAIEQEIPPDSAPAAPAAPIPPSDLASQANADVTELSLIRELLRPDLELSRIAEDLPILANERQRLVRETGAALGGATPRRLNELRDRWNSQTALLTGWEAAVGRRAEQLDRELARMRGIVDLWTRQRAFIDSIGGASAVIERASSIIAAGDTLAVLFDERFNAVLTIQDKIADGLIEASEMAARIQTAQELARQRLLVRESPPIWDAFAAVDTPSLASQLRDTLREDVGTLRAYVADHREDLIEQAVFFLLLLGFMVWLSRTSRRWPDSVLHDESMAGSLQAVRRPFAAALLLTLWLTPTFQPRRPEIVGDLAALVAIVPVLRLIPRRMFQTLRTPIYGLIVLFVLVQTSQMLDPASPVFRLILLVLNVSALVGLVWVLRRGSELESLRSSTGWGAVSMLARVGVVVLAVALVANVIGNVSLGETLTIGVVSAAMYAVLVYALVWVLHGLWRLLLRSRAAQALNVIHNHRDTLDRIGCRLISMAGIFLWIWISLRLVRLWAPLVAWAQTALSMSFTIGSVTIQVGGVLAFLAVILITTFVSRTLRVILAEDVLTRTRLPRGMPGTISTVVHYTIITLGFLLAMAAAGIELSRVVVLAGALGVGIGFGLQDIVRNFVSGLILAFERPFGIGDVVEVGTLLGKVRRIGARSSTIRTYDGADVIVPNSNLVSNQVVNWTLNDTNRRITMPVGVAFGSDTERVLQVLREVADANPGVLKYPEPLVLFRGFGDSSLNFELRFWIADIEMTLRTGSEMTSAVHDALAAAGITIPFPQRDLHLKTVGDDGEVKKIRAAIQKAEPQLAPSQPTTDR